MMSTGSGYCKDEVNNLARQASRKIVPGVFVVEQTTLAPVSLPALVFGAWSWRQQRADHALTLVVLHSQERCVVAL